MKLSLHFQPSTLKPHHITHSSSRSPHFAYLKKFDSQFSFIGISPFLSFQYFHPYTYTYSHHSLSRNQCSIFSKLKSFLQSFQLILPKSLPLIPFFAGGIGFFSYDLIYSLFNIPQPHPQYPHIPLASWTFYDLIYIYHHPQKQGFFSLIFPQKSPSPLKSAQNLISLWEKFFLNSLNPSHTQKYSKSTPTHSTQFQPSISQTQYIQAVQKIKSAILNGYVYQINFTYQLSCHFPFEPFPFFQHISNNHPTPFSAYLNFQNFKVLSFSPELFVQASQNHVLVQPMKGTSPRHPNPKYDSILKNQLLSSKKDLAELVMIVDLLRNDLGKVSQVNSVKVQKFPELQTFNSVYQLTSSISSLLHPQYHLVDLILALFPSGSISGCPKSSAIQLIHSLENTPRSLFMGNLGFISFHNSLQLNVLIRTLCYSQNQLLFQVGSGIVHDSDPLKEYQETLHKSAFLKPHLNS